MASLTELYNLAKGPAFDTVGAFEEGQRAAHDNKTRKRQLQDLARADESRAVMGQSLGGDKSALSRLSTLDPESYMAVNKYQGEQAKAQREYSDGEREKIIGAFYAADTPEKWARTADYLAQQGYDIDDDDRDFSNREAIIGVATGVGGQVKQQQFDQGYELDRMNAETNRMNAEKRGETGGGFSLTPGQTRYDANGKQLAAAPQKPLQPRALTSVDKNAILEADDQIAAGENTVEMLKRALELNDKAGTGAFATTQAYAARNDPTGLLDKEKGAATTEFNNIVAGQALSSMKAIFGGNPTEGERSILLELQGMADKSPTERKSIIERGIKLAERRVLLNRERAKSIRNGSYFGGASTVEATGGNPYPGADGITNQDQGGGFEQQGDIPMAAIEMLTSDTSPEARAEFDEAFGAGAAAYVLGQ